ncbi:MAG: hypothetical protein QM802_17095 [Agriterribacter sp.]
MKKTIFVTFLLIVSCIPFLHAQSVTPDSTLSPKLQKEILKISKRLDENKLELIKQEGKLKDAEDKVKTKESEAKQSASDNERAASKLSDDATDKRKARRARKSADAASDDAKEARKAARDLESLKKKIETLQKDIADDKAELVKMNVIPKEK